MMPASQARMAKMVSRIQPLGCWYTPSNAALDPMAWTNATHGQVPGHLPDAWHMGDTGLVECAQDGTSKGGPPHFHHPDLTRAGKPGDQAHPRNVRL
eukprot:1555241-Amphidinium_carterae.1